MKPPSPFPQFNLPVVGVDADTLDERHWRRMSIGEPIVTACQAFCFMPPNTGWHISAFFTSDDQKVTGRTSYRAPASFKAWWEIAPQVIGKWWARWRGKQ